LAISVVLSLLLAEFLVRIVAPQDIGTVLNIYQFDPDLKYKLQPNVSVYQVAPEFTVEYITNSHGFRDKDYETRKPSGTCRLLIVGDSISIGHGLEQESVYGHLLEQMLNDKSADTDGGRWEVINTSVGGYQFYMYVEAIRRYAPKFDADIVMIGFYIGNDFRDINKNARMIIKDGYLRGWDVGLPKDATRETNFGRRLRTFFAPIRVFLATNSHLYVLARSVTISLMDRLQLGILKQETNLELFRTASDSTRFDTIERYIREAKEIVDSQGASLLLFIIPQKIQVEDNSYSVAVADSGLAPEQVGRDEPNRRLIQILDRHNIRYVDMLPVMRDRSNEYLYFSHDGHWNAAGHLAGAEVLVKYFQTLAEHYSTPRSEILGSYDPYKKLSQEERQDDANLQSQRCLSTFSRHANIRSDSPYQGCRRLRKK